MRFLSLILLAACAEEMEPEYYEGEPEQYYQLDLWVEDHPDIDPEIVRLGCEAWAPEGLMCDLVEAPEEADLVVEVDTSEVCEIQDHSLFRETYFLGEKTQEGLTVLHLACLQDTDTASQDDILRAVSAHEVGHQVGIYFHVWPDCRTVDERDPGEAGPPLCGPAIMNTEVNLDLFRMTVPDHQAWMSRNTTLSVIDEPLPLRGGD